MVHSEPHVALDLERQSDQASPPADSAAVWRELQLCRSQVNDLKLREQELMEYVFQLQVWRARQRERERAWACVCA